MMMPLSFSFLVVIARIFALSRLSAHVWVLYCIRYFRVALLGCLQRLTLGRSLAGTFGASKRVPLVRDGRH